jgi:hypothetical protein
MEHVVISDFSRHKHTSIETSVELDTREEALGTFAKACEKILDIPGWGKVMEPGYIRFILQGANRNEERGLAQVGDYFSTQSSLSDKERELAWAKVELIDDRPNPGGEEERFALRIRASHQPELDKSIHFHSLKSNSVSCFQVGRTANRVIASYSGNDDVKNIAAEALSESNGPIAFGAFKGINVTQILKLLQSVLMEKIEG